MVWLIWISRISFTARISATWTFAAFAELAAEVGWRRWKRKVRARRRVENMMMDDLNIMLVAQYRISADLI